ncbi:enoyl-CoA hydratase/isomerase family protein [Ensifer soli]|uniref:enoyl-CoA hydratase/isomerase family protein n=1 Tax=Ciceribacter sp. sgz301302 TaxID=3342379 RepID=UPI0035BA47E1
MTLAYDTNGPIGTFTIENGPVNVFNPATHAALYEALRAFEADPDIKVGVMRGAGTRAFSAGDDLKFPTPVLDVEQKLTRHFYHTHFADTEPGYPGWDREVMALRRFKPIVAAVNGWCLGRGFMYLLHLTDIRVAGQSARFGMPEIKFGMGGGGAMMLAHRHLPRAVAMQLLLTGEPIDANEAHRVNIINRVVPDAEVGAAALAIAEGIAAHPQTAIRTEMEAYLRTEDMDRENALAFAEHLYRLQRLAASGQNADIDFKKG